MRSDIVPGGVFPGYERPDHTNTMRTLSELQGEDPMILTLARRGVVKAMGLGRRCRPGEGAGKARPVEITSKSVSANRAGSSIH